MTTGVIPPETVGNRLVRAREYAQLDQTQLADILGVSRATVSNYERGLRAPKRHVFISWAQVTGVDEGWLKDGDAAAWEALRARRDSNPQPSDPESRRTYGRAA